MAELKDIFVYDLMAKLRKDTARCRVVQNAIDEMDTLHRKARDGKADRKTTAMAVAKVVEVCGFNFGAVIPHIFPRYPLSAPLSLLERPFMFVTTSLAANTTVTLRAGRQVGKCADGDTEVTTAEHGALTLRQIFLMGDAKSDASASAAGFASSDLSRSS